MASLLIENIGLLASPQGKEAKRGPSQKDVAFLNDAYVYIEDGIIKETGTGKNCK